MWTWGLPALCHCACSRNSGQRGPGCLLASRRLQASSNLERFPYFPQTLLKLGNPVRHIEPERGTVALGGGEQRGTGTRCLGERTQPGGADSRETRPRRLLQLPFIEHYKILCIYFHIKTIFLQIRYEVPSHWWCPWLEKTLTQLEIEYGPVSEIQTRIRHTRNAKLYKNLLKTSCSSGGTGTEQNSLC